MALPFGAYEGQDLTEYEAGNKFLPRQFYSLNTTPSTELASTVGNTGGVTNTSAAYPYIWPPQGGGGGGNFGGPNNKFGLNMDTLKTISQPRYVEQGGPANMYGGNYVKDDRRIAQTEGGIWKDVDTGQNVYHANLNVKTPMTMIIDKLTGKKTTGDPYAGTWYGSDWSDEDEEKGFYSRATGPKNIIQRWKANREIKKQEKIAADKAAADAAAATGPRWRTEGGGQGTPGAGGENVRSSSGDVYGGEAYGYNEAAEKSDYYKHGGRIGYAYGTPDPEEPAENVFEFTQDQNIPMSEQVEGEGDILSMLVAKYIEAGFPPDQAEEMAMQEFQQMAMGAEQDQGLASLV